MGGVLLAAALGSSLLSVSLSPSSVSGSSLTGSGDAGSMSAIVAGAAGAATYEWTVVDTNLEGTVAINSPTSSSTDFHFAGVPAGETSTATVRCTVTIGGNSASADGVVAFTNRSRF